jgi:hypothetical protein
MVDKATSMIDQGNMRANFVLNGGRKFVSDENANASKNPIIVLGAARSGTKMLRDAIASHPSLIAIPHDINFIWKYGNYRIGHDCLRPDDVTPSTTKFIHRFFEKARKGRTDLRVVEKTVSNTLRVKFVKQIFPSCLFIHLVRDGRDVTCSSMAQWHAPLEILRVLKIVKHLPIKAFPTYVRDYLTSYMVKKRSGEKPVSSWGVVPEDLQELLLRYSLVEVCSLQWKRSIDSTVDALRDVSPDQKILVRYEEFVQDPQKEMERILSFLGLETHPRVLQHLGEHVKPGYEGKWKTQMESGQMDLIMTHISSTLHQLGYLH